MKQSMEYTIFGDLDGMTVAELREMLDNYPDDAYIDAQSEKVYGFSEDREFFVFKWSDE